MPVTLPPDVVNEVYKSAERWNDFDRDDKKDMFQACALVAPPWRYDAQARLFRTIVLRTLRRSVSFQTLLQNNEELASHVRQLCVCVNLVDNLRTPAFTMLRKLHLDHSTATAAVTCTQLIAVEALVMLPTLDVLTIHNTHFSEDSDLFRIFCRASSLLHFDFTANRAILDVVAHSLDSASASDDQPGRLSMLAMDIQGCLGAKILHHYIRLNASSLRHVRFTCYEGQ